MARIRITKEFSFEMAHALWNYDGSCSNIHGHSYKLSVTLSGIPVNDKMSPKYGMVVDFTDIKKWVKNTIVDEFDHALLISSDADLESVKSTKQMFNKLRVTPFQPTCENLLLYIADKIKNQLPVEISLYSLKLRETGSSYAEWYAEDNA
jgi:6-pyruvoyltetrahydropterin/6-carboxytetrahydropterin synthase